MVPQLYGATFGPFLWSMQLTHHLKPAAVHAISLLQTFMFFTGLSTPVATRLKQARQVHIL